MQAYNTAPVVVVSQTKRGSAFETVTNTLVGFSINWCANMVILPMFGMPINGTTAFHMGIIFTAISIARGYVLRRVFNKITERSLSK
ncbi:conserved hypothetical protein [Xanthomonas phage OP1]|uniref:Uncharacterized protein n=1 Tax=Xanthomonas phage OP1 TaxID=2994040 RepID=Q2NPF6_9CAUD|nr:hypothetical protein OP1_ORF35 [Xanthomonas phage OP1]BAE72740.1 conserved hypothetical protein [Xanthomonas phage OP1]